MSNSKIIAVVGATGAQGGGLARAILDDLNGGFRCRALTRNPEGDAARPALDAGRDLPTHRRRRSVGDPSSVIVHLDADLDRCSSLA